MSSSIQATTGNFGGLVQQTGTSPTGRDPTAEPATHPVDRKQNAPRNFAEKEEDVVCTTNRNYHTNAVVSIIIHVASDFKY